MTGSMRISFFTNLGFERASSKLAVPPIECPDKVTGSLCFSTNCYKSSLNVYHDFSLLDSAIKSVSP